MILRIAFGSLSDEIHPIEKRMRDKITIKEKNRIGSSMIIDNLIVKVSIQIYCSIINHSRYYC